MMGIINENKLKHYIKEQVEKETKGMKAEMEKIWGYLNQYREEVQSLRVKLRLLNNGT